MTGYFESPWTRLEFEEILVAGLPLVIGLIEGASLPSEVSRRLPAGALVRDGVDAAVCAVCELYRRQTAAFAGRHLCQFVPERVEEYRYWAYATYVPALLQPARARNHWCNSFGDHLWVRISPSGDEIQRAIFEALRGEALSRRSISYSRTSSVRWTPFLDHSGC